MSDMIEREAAMELRDSLADIIGARPMSSIHSALSEYRKAIAALPAAQPAQGEADPHVWTWQSCENSQGWNTKYGDAPPAPSPWIEDVQPLYAHPPTAPDSAELDALVADLLEHAVVYVERFCSDETKAQQMRDAITALRAKGVRT